jgi:hypothetical protein
LESTLPSEADLRALRRYRSIRRLFFVLLIAFLLLGSLNVFGVQTKEISRSGKGYELTLIYASVSRPGLATPWRLEVRRSGGFDSPITVVSTARYFELFDENSLDPAPSKTTRGKDLIIWEFDPPQDNETLTVSFDARIEPGEQLAGVSGKTSVLRKGVPVISINYRTFVMP